ncbi:NAD(P)H-hydrate dehydratase [Candidatus Parcubacteria bacterium]|nr:NAD(P)H-hydrate dehydratase [Candidatus Parcubacteria bacterium]
MIKVSPKLVKKAFPIRSGKKYFKKYDFGLLLVIGGSDFYSGSPALNALAGFRVGVGMVRILAPKRAADIIASFSPDLAAFPLEGKWLLKEHLPILLTMTKSAIEVAYGNVACVIGGGLGRTKETQETVIEYVKNVNIPLVIDADAIYALAKAPEIFANKPILFTPHGFEFFVLTGTKIDEDLPLKKKVEIVKKSAEKLKTTILYKTKPDIITDGKKVFLNYAGTPFLAVGGTGDTLAGICGALMARKIEPLLAGAIGAYLNGRAGEIAAEKLREGLLATDVINHLPEAIKEIFQN